MRDFADDLFARAKDQHEPVLRTVTLSTLHAAKGLEWPEVYLVGCSEGLLPISYASGFEAIDEERRLCYVGVTRARKRLTLSLCLTRMKWGKTKPGRPSRFLYELTGQAEKFVESAPPRDGRKVAAPRRV